MVYGTYNELVTGAYKPTYNWGAPHCSIGLKMLTLGIEYSTNIPPWINPIVIH